MKEPCFNEKLRFSPKLFNLEQIKLEQRHKLSKHVGHKTDKTNQTINIVGFKSF